MAFQISCLIFLLFLLAEPNKGSEDSCLSHTQIFVKELNKCCQRCPPGYRMKSKCTQGTETECVACSSGTWSEGYSYYSTCNKCTNCDGRGLTYAKNCSTEEDAKCICQLGQYCIMGYKKPYCSECTSYTKCIPGQGVISAGTDIKNVRCGPCPSGTFSSQNSFTEECRPHSTCGPEGILQMGNSTSDTVCISGLAAGPAIITTTTQSTTLRSPTTQQPLTTHISTHIEPPEVIPVPSSGTTPGATNMIDPSVVTGVVCLIAIVCVCAGAVVYCVRRRTGSPEKETKVINCVEAGILTSQNHPECQVLLNHSGPPEPLVSLTEKPSTGPSSVPSSGPSSGPSIGHNSLSNCYVNQDDSRCDHPQSPTVHQVVNVNVNIMAPTPTASSAPPAPPAPPAPSGSSTPRPNGRPPEPDSDLPLSQEEEVHVPTGEAEQWKEAHTSVPETGREGREGMDFDLRLSDPKTRE